MLIPSRTYSILEAVHILSHTHHGLTFQASHFFSSESSEQQKLEQKTTELLFGWVFDV